MLYKIKCILLFIIFFGHTTMASRILAIFPYPSYSHQVAHQPLTEELAERGHELIVFTTAPMNRSITNLREISLHHLFPEYRKRLNFVELSPLGLWAFSKRMYAFGAYATDETLGHPEMQRLISSNKSSDKIDLILVSAFYWDALYYLSDVFNAPIIGISSMPYFGLFDYIMGNPLSTSYIPNVLIGYDDDMTFLQRINNFYYNLRTIYEYHYMNLPLQDKILKKYFGNDVPPIEELSKRISMVFFNGHSNFCYQQPLVPSILRIGGIRTFKQIKPLPTELKTLLDNSTQGFIYFSLGSNVRSTELNKGILNAFIETFSELPYQIIWKFESDNLEGKSDNIYISKWLPQDGILRHENLKLFIYQGGFQSTEEVIDSGVPILGIPILIDQMTILKNLENRGVGKAIPLDKINKYIFKETIRQIISNSSYRENMIKLRELLYDRPQHPLNESVWWVEHVIRHKGAPHLRTRSRDLTWFTIELVDIYCLCAILLVVLFLLGWTLSRLAITMIKVLCSSFFDKINGPSKIKNKSKTS